LAFSRKNFVYVEFMLVKENVTKAQNGHQFEESTIIIEQTIEDFLNSETNWASKRK
jgi:hypothetical protein